ncbi:MAG: hypothetical protein WBY67_05230 [Pseudolabrys sp.]
MDIELHQTVEPDHRKLPPRDGVGRNAAYASVHRGDVETMRVGDLTAPLRRKLGIEVAE